MSSVDNSTRDIDIIKFPTFRRNKYFTGKLLTAQDFQTEQEYFINKSRLLNRVVHGSGVACGLEVIKSGEEEPGTSLLDSTQIRVLPGIAIDSCGREIIVPEPVTIGIPESLRQNNTIAQVQLYFNLTSVDSQPNFVEGSTCDQECCASIVQEGYQIKINSVQTLTPPILIPPVVVKPNELAPTTSEVVAASPALVSSSATAVLLARPLIRITNPICTQWTAFIANKENDRFNVQNCDNPNETIGVLLAEVYFKDNQTLKIVDKVVNNRTNVYSNKFLYDLAFCLKTDEKLISDEVTRLKEIVCKNLPRILDINWIHGFTCSTIFEWEKICEDWLSITFSQSMMLDTVNDDTLTLEAILQQQVRNEKGATKIRAISNDIPKLVSHAVIDEKAETKTGAQVAFRPDPSSIYYEKLFTSQGLQDLRYDGPINLKMRIGLKSEFIKNKAGDSCLDGTFLKEKLPTGARCEGGRFESWIKLAVSGIPEGLVGEYYGDIAFTDPKFRRRDLQIDYTWGAAPDNTMAQTNFSVRWTGYVTPKYSEDYTFFANSDDGTRLWIDGKQVIENWGIHPPIEVRSEPIPLIAGKRYFVKLEYYQASGGATAQLSWSSKSQSKGIIPQQHLHVPGGLFGQYYKDEEFKETKMCRIDPTIDFNWQSESPDASIPPDHFSIRWTGWITAMFSEECTFYVISDDGTRLWIDGKQVIENWGIHAPREAKSDPIMLTAGKRYAIRLDYYESGGGAMVQLMWSSKSSPAKTIIPQSQLEVDLKVPPIMPVPPIFIIPPIKPVVIETLKPVGWVTQPSYLDVVATGFLQPVVSEIYAPVTAATVTPVTVAPVAPVSVAPVIATVVSAPNAPVITAPVTVAPVTVAPIKPPEVTSVIPITVTPVAVTPVSVTPVAPVTANPVTPVKPVEVTTVTPATIAPAPAASVTVTPTRPAEVTPVATVAPVIVAPVTVAPVVRPIEVTPVTPTTFVPTTNVRATTVTPRVVTTVTGVPVAPAGIGLSELIEPLKSEGADTAALLKNMNSRGIITVADLSKLSVAELSSRFGLNSNQAQSLLTRAKQAEG